MKNPYPQVCPKCKSKIYATIRPIWCPKCSAKWPETELLIRKIKGNPMKRGQMIKLGKEFVCSFCNKPANTKDKYIIAVGKKQYHMKCFQEARKIKNPDSKLYHDFHGASPARVRKIEYENPDPSVPLVKIGRLSQINYVPEKPSTKTGSEFYHVSGDTGEKTLKSNLILATDSKGKNLYLLRDRKSKFPVFNERGIIG